MLIFCSEVKDKKTTLKVFIWGNQSYDMQMQLQLNWKKEPSASLLFSFADLAIGAAYKQGCSDI